MVTASVQPVNVAPPATKQAMWAAAYLSSGYVSDPAQAQAIADATVCDKAECQLCDPRRIP